MNVRIVPLALLAVALGLFSAAPARADVVVSNLGDLTFNGAWTLGDGSTLVDSPVANQFTTGPGPGWTLNSVEFYLGLRTGTPQSNISAFLFTDSGGLPGTALLELTGPAPTTLAEVLTYTPVAPFTLAPNTSYWLVLSAWVTDNYGWLFRSDTTETGLPGWSIGNTALAGAPAGSWTPLDFFGDPAPTLFQVNASAVPEPASLTLFAVVGVVGLAGAARKRRKATASGA